VEEGSSRNTYLVGNLDDGVDLNVVMPEQSKLGTGRTGTKPAGDSQYDEVDRKSGSMKDQTYWMVRPCALKRA
jgi:hypothetical protein